MQLITYNAQIAATAGATRIYFAPHLQERPKDDPERRFVGAMALYHHAVDRGELPGPYTDAAAELYARGVLVDDADFLASADLPDEALAERFGVPVEQIAAKRTDERGPAPPWPSDAHGALEALTAAIDAAQLRVTSALEVIAEGVAHDAPATSPRRDTTRELLDVARDVHELVGNARLVGEAAAREDGATMGLRARELADRADELRAALEASPAPGALRVQERVVPAEAREAARHLSSLFARDQELVGELNDTAERLGEANDQLTAGLSAESLQAIYGPGGPDLGLSGRRPPVLDDDETIAALERVAQEIRSAFSAHQHRADERRILGMDIGEANAELQRAMTAAAFTEHEARNADVGALAEGVLRLIDERS